MPIIYKTKAKPTSPPKKYLGEKIKAKAKPHGEWRTEAIVCLDCGYTGVARINDYWVLSKFMCNECKSENIKLDT